MKIIHTSDWHLGNSFHQFNREEEFLDFFKQLRQIVSEEQPDALLVSGDIFDTVAPSNAVVSIYNRELLALQQENPEMQVIITAGNHDSPSRLASAGVLWKEFRVTVVGSPERNEEGINMEKLLIPIRRKERIIGWVLAVPYIHESSFPQVEPDGYVERVRAFYGRLLECVNQKREAGQPIIAMGHLALSNSDLTGHDSSMKGNMVCVSADIWAKGFSYVALGHIHRPQHVGFPFVRYSGSVIPMSFDEKYEHSVTVVEFDGEQMTKVRQRIINAPIEICDVPEEPAPFEEVKEALKAFPSDKAAYIRFNVLIDDVVPSTLFEEAQMCLEGKKAKLCTFLRTNSRSLDSKETGKNAVHSLEELRHLSPMDIIERCYRAAAQQELSETLRACMKEAIEEVEKGKREESL